jgi:hypothetical protein
MSAKRKGNPAEGFGFDLSLPKPPPRTTVPEAEAARFVGDDTAGPRAPEKTPTKPEMATEAPSQAGPKLAPEPGGPELPAGVVVTAPPTPPAPLPAPQASAETTLAPEAPAPTGRRVRVRKTDGVPMRRTTVWLKAGMARRLALFCADRGISQTDVIEAALADHLGRHGGLAPRRHSGVTYMRYGALEA